MTSHEWILAHARYSGDDCLPWPFTRDWQGRGLLGVHGKIRKAHRVMCEAAHGPAPTKLHHAAHECGNGHLGCINPRHLSWKTKEENARDRIRHGHPGGNRNGPQTLFTPLQVEELRRHLRAGVSVTKIAAQMGVARSVITYWKAPDPNKPIRHGVHKRSKTYRPQVPQAI